MAIDQGPAPGAAGLSDESYVELTPGQRLLRFLDRNSVWVLLAIAVLAASLLTKFEILQNILNLGAAVSSLGMLVLAQTVVLLTRNFDLSTEANMVFGAVLAGVLISPVTILGEGTADQLNLGGRGWSTGAVLPILLIVCTAVGLANGLLIVKLRMNNFMVTLGMSILLYGLTLVVGVGRQLTTIPEAFRWLGKTRIDIGEDLKFPISAIFLVLVFVVFHYVLTRTVYGRRIYAVGSNRDAARAAGINDGNVIIGAYVVSGLLCGIAAWLLVGRLGAAQAGISADALFTSFAAAVIGGVSLGGGRGKIFGVFGGLLLMGTITNALNISNVEGKWIPVANGLVILFAIFIDGLRNIRAARLTGS
ncbi:MAG: ABC transporter permease [bacterium]|nr:ABC transporter permease [bacterium]MXV91597.1 ABC transporter permease [Acidimicrobiia bacterium]MYC45772.1 ABC transporter permease [Acidimicrobiia bacterium]